MFSITHHESKKNLPARAHIVTPERKTACGLPIDHHILVDDGVAERGIEGKAYTECMTCRTNDARARAKKVQNMIRSGKHRRHVRAS